MLIIIFQFFAYRKDYASIERKLKKKQSELDFVSVKFREVDILKSEIVSLAAHQIRSPLVAIIGYVSMMREGDYGAVNDGLKDPLSSVSSSADYLLTLVNEFLDIHASSTVTLHLI